MLSYDKTIETENFFTVYPLGDFHYGSPQCDTHFIESHINRIKRDPQGYVVLMGDLTENNVVDSAGSVYSQIKNPKSQLNEIVDLLKPIKDKILFGIESNHSMRSYNKVGLSIDNLICDALEIPYGISCYAYLVAKNPKRNASYAYKCFFHHGRGGGITKGAKINIGVKLAELAPTAEAIFYGHTHLTSRIPESFKDMVSSGGEVYLVNRNRFLYNTGSALIFDNSYAEEKGYPPAVKEFTSVDFYSPVSGTSSRKQVYRTWGTD